MPTETSMKELTPDRAEIQNISHRYGLPDATNLIWLISQAFHTVNPDISTHVLTQIRVILLAEIVYTAFCIPKPHLTDPLIIIIQVVTHLCICDNYEVMFSEIKFNKYDKVTGSHRNANEVYFGLASGQMWATPLILHSITELPRAPCNGFLRLLS